MPLIFAFFFALAAFSPCEASFELDSEYYEDASASLTAETVIASASELKWKSLKENKGRFGFSKSRFWIRFRIPEKDLKYGDEDPVMLEIPFAYNEHISLYRARQGKLIKTSDAGMGVRISERSSSVLRTGFPSFRISAPRFEDNDYYLAVDGTFPVSVPLTLWEAPEYAYHHWTGVLFVGVFLGLLILAALVNGIMAAILRSKIYWNYSFFVASVLMLYLGHEGLTVQLLWPESPWWAMREIHVYGTFALYFYAQFVREFLESKRQFPWLDRFLLFLIGLSTIRGIWILVDPHFQPVVLLGQVAVMLSNVLVLVIALRALNRGTRSAPYFFFSSLVFNLAMILFVLQESNLIWIGEFMARAPHVGTALEVLLLSLALADRIKLVNQELAEQKAAVVHADKISALGRMAGEIAHEINNPLAIIHGNASLLARLELPQQAREISLTIEQTAVRISKVVKGMRALARDTRNDPFQPASFASLLQDSLVVCQDRIRNAGVKLSAPEPDPQLTLHCRPSEISQVLVNLLANALDASEGRTGVWVKVEAERQGEMLEISVTDNGCGIPKPLRGRVHEPFFTTKEAGKGLGLGLSIARTIVENHGGNLWLDENREHTRFVFTVPLAGLEGRA